MRQCVALLAVLVGGIACAQPFEQSSTPLTIRLTDSIACTSVKDQSESPTCWVFGTNSLFESDHIKIYQSELNLSEMFIARYAYIDKARQWLAMKGKTYFAGGGQFHDVIRVVDRYGMVPEETYPGIPRGGLNHNHARLDTAMQQFARKLLKKGKTVLSDKDVAQINDTLDKYLGRVPQKFWYKSRQYTPRTFADEIVHFNNDYVEVVSFRDHPLYKRFILEDKYNWARDSFYNLRLTEMEMLVDSALARGWSIGWEGDVTEPGFNFFAGYASIDTSSVDYDSERVADYQSGSTERDHMLHIVGVGYDPSGGKWYYMKNSWGRWFSKYKGFLYMNENYFRLKTVVLMVNRAALPKDFQTKLNLQSNP